MHRLGSVTPAPYAAAMSEPYLSGISGRMIDLPHRGNLLALQCKACGRQVEISGREIVTRFTKWLPAMVSEWAATLRCSACQSRHVMVYAKNDPAAQGFHVSTMEPGQIVWARRLNTWLHEVGSDIWEYRRSINGMCADDDLGKAGIRRFGPETDPAPQ